jgi:hypothetical protein
MFLRSIITSKIDMEYLENTHNDNRTPTNTGTIWLDYPVNSRTMMAGDIYLVTDPDIAAAPTIA